MNHRVPASTMTKRRAIVNSLYNAYPMGVPVKAGASNVAQKINFNYSSVSDVLNALRGADIINVEIKYGKEFGTGRASYLTLVKSREDALKAVDGFVRTEISLKDKIIAVMTAHPYIKTTKELIDYIKADYGTAADAHNLTHVLYSLKKEGKLTFGNGTTKDRVPYNIRLTWKNLTESPVATQDASATAEDINVAPEPTIEVEPSPEASEPVVFPLIEALVNRQYSLQQAAKFAEMAGADDIALSLLERAESPLSPLEKEIIALYNKCMGN